MWAVGDNNDSGVNKCTKIDSSDDINGLIVDHDSGIAEIIAYDNSDCIGAHQMVIDGPGKCASSFKTVDGKMHYFTHYFVRTK